MPTTSPHLPPSDDVWPPRRPADLTPFSDQHLLERMRRLLAEAERILVEAERRQRDRDGGQPL